MTTTTAAANNPTLPAPLNQNHPKTQADWQQILNQLQSWQNVLGIIVPPMQQTDAERTAGVTPTNYAYEPGRGYDVRRCGAACDGVTDDTAAIQRAISICAATANWGSLIIPGKCRVTSSLIIDRLVQTMQSEFLIQGVGPQAGFYVTGNVTMFDSSLSAPSSPQSEFVTFQNIRFESSAQANTAFVCSQKFLRMKFLHCTFYNIRCLNASYYIQTWKFETCLIKANPGYFIQAPGSYDVCFQDCEVGNYGSISGSLIRIDNSDSSSRGCNGLRIINNLIEGMSSGTAWLTGCSGLLIQGNHIEANSAPDFNLFVAGLTHHTVAIVGNYIFNPNGAFMYYGPATNVVSVANTVTKGGSGTANAGLLHSNAAQITNLFSMADSADGGVSDNPFTYALGALNVQGPTAGLSPTTATRIINRRVSLTYSASINIDASLGNSFEINATNGTAFTINTPTNGVDGQFVEITILNTSGGALGTATFGANYKTGAAWTQPANGFNRTIRFQLSSTAWYERSRTATDVSN